VSPADELAIHRVVLRYCRGIDRMDRELVRSCYHPEATDSHGSFNGGVEEFLDWVWRILGRYTATMHYIANQLVDGAADDRARCESYGVAIHRTDGGEARGNLTTGFRFVDDFSRRDGDWRIIRRVATTEWVRVERDEERWPIPADMLTGRRDRSDAVYAPWGP
jgi:SnoaL-like domain